MQARGTRLGAGVRKPRKEETAGRKRCWLVGRDLWGFEDRGRSADVSAEPSGAQSCRREHRRRACSVVRRCGFGVGVTLGAGLRKWRGQRSGGPARGWQRKRSALRGGMGCDGHEVSILIRFGDGDRAGRALEGLDDDHPAAATGASARRRRGFGVDVGLGRRGLALGLGRGERLAGTLDALGANGAGQQAVVPDAMEAAGYDVRRKRRMNSAASSVMVLSRSRPSIR